MKIELFSKTSISLVLVVVLFICLCAAVYAADFTDGNRIGLAYREAVEQMTAQGVLNGFPDGSFQPTGTLTREQGAKIVAYMILGDEVNGLTCSAAPFNDVAANRWSAPCIAWCVEHGILLGYGDGRYGPNDTLTGDQFAKMLLCAFGFGDSARYAGNGWYEAVREEASAVDLYEGDAGMASNNPVQRQQAALLAWNAVKAAGQAEEPIATETPVESKDPMSFEIPEISEPTVLPAGEPYTSTELPEIEIPITTEEPQAGPQQETGPGSVDYDGGDVELPDVP